MISAIRMAAIPGLLALSTACGVATSLDSAVDDPAGVDVAYTGDRYTGTVIARVFEPGQSRVLQKDSGTGSVQFIDSGKGRSRLVVKASIDGQTGDAGFVMDGKQGESGWNGGDGGLLLAVGNDGTITGGGVVQNQRRRFGGKASAEGIDLEVEIEMLARGQGQSAGAKILFDYDLRRDTAKKDARVAATRSSGNASKPKSKLECTQTVWQWRYVARPDGDSSMIQIPVCVN